MSLPVRVRPEAESDIDEAFRWYESQAEGLGARFLDGLDRIFDRISEHPQIHAAVHRGVRMTLVSRFPYLVCYLAGVDEIEVIAVVHAHRNPTEWQSRA